VYFALACASLTFLITRDARSTISVIIVAGACGIEAGTPLAILGAIGRAAKAGAIVRGGRYIESLAATDVVVLDKTGTLTLGRPEVIAVEPDGASELELLRVAASADRYSEHRRTGYPAKGGGAKDYDGSRRGFSFGSRKRYYLQGGWQCRPDWLGYLFA